MRVVSFLLHSCRIALLESNSAESTQAGGNLVLLLPCHVSLPAACRQQGHFAGGAVYLLALTGGRLLAGQLERPLQHAAGSRRLRAGWQAATRKASP
jgi:hypothetical protein